MNAPKEKPKKIKQDWTVRRKKIFDGKMAPAGRVFIVIKVRKRYEMAMLINGMQGKEAEYDVQLHLRGLIKDKYKV